MRTINYESDFKLIEGFKDGSSILAAPFRFTYNTKVSRGVYVAEYNGSEFVNCIPTEDGRVIVPFDSPKLGMGVLTVKREFFLNDADFADGVCNLVSVESTGITLDKGATDDLGEIEVFVEPYYHTISGGGGGDIPNGSITEVKLANSSVSTSKIKDGAVTMAKLGSDVMKALDAEIADGSITEAKLSEEVREKLNQGGGSGEKGEDGKSAYEIWLEQGNEGSEQDFLDSLKGDQGIQGEKGDKMTYDDLTEEEKNDLASRVEVDVPEIPEDILDKMITAEPAEGDSEEVTDYVLMLSDVEHTLGDTNKPISQAAVSSAINSIEEMIVSVINTPT